MVSLIAELGINHQGSMETMKELMLTAKNCGADYVKSQKREPKECLTEEQYNRPYDSIHGFGKTYGEHKENLEFSISQWKELLTYSQEIDIPLFASVFDVTSARNMHDLGMDIYKIGSGNIHDFELLEEVKSYRKLILISSGMSTIEEVDRAVDVFDNSSDLVIMHCTSAYPCAETDVNLNVMTTLKERYKRPIGLSGHYVQGNGSIESAAVALGATWIERHFTLDRTMKGTDQASSLEDTGLRRVIKSIRSVEDALGSAEKKVLDVELEVRKKVRG